MRHDFYISRARSRRLSGYSKTGSYSAVGLILAIVTRKTIIFIKIFGRYLGFDTWTKGVFTGLFTLAFHG
jgi:hypothetical protein